MPTYNQEFIHLLYIFHASAMQALGKVKSPISGKTEINLEQAKQAIDILEMIKEKTQGNLNNEELEAIESFLSEMNMHYHKESNKN